jgi:hypothetical protein
VPFSTRLQAQEFFASARESEVDFTPSTSPMALIRFTFALKRTCKTEERCTRAGKLASTRQNCDGAGATPPFDAPCVTVARGVAPAPPVLKGVEVLYDALAPRVTLVIGRGPKP